MKTKTIKTLALTGLTAASFALPALADQYDVSKEELNKAERNYSPGVGQNFPLRVYWGDTHLHTSYSTDAGMAVPRSGRRRRTASRAARRSFPTPA